MNMNMGGRSFDKENWSFLDIIEGINIQIQMLDRVIRRVYPQCHQAYQCHYASQMFDYFPG